jgi:hypothetical protein
MQGASGMSKENVALFVRALAEKRDLNRRAAAETNAEAWAAIGNEAGLDFTAADLVDFVNEVTGKAVTADNAVKELLQVVTAEDGRMSDADLESVVGGFGGTMINFSSALSRTLVRAGYTPPGGLGAQYVEFPPDSSKAQGGL